MKRLKGRFMPYKHFPYLGIAYLLFLFGFIIAGSKVEVKYEFLSPLASEKAEANELQNFKVSFNKTNYITLKTSHYWPELGGVNCGNFVDGVCISKMANGEKWQDWVGVAIGCPKELKFGTRIEIGLREWICMDRGSKIVKNGDVYWVDMLTPYALFDYGELVVGKIL